MLLYTTYLLLDAGRVGNPDMQQAARDNNPNECLFSFDKQYLSGVAPYCFQFSCTTPFANWYFKNGWGHSWGVLIKSSWPLPALSNLLRKYLRINIEAGQECYFRFYDPRVLRIFLPTCHAAQIRKFFGNAIEYFIVEDEDPDFALRFSHQNGSLQTERFSVKEEIAGLPGPEPLPPEPIAILQERGIVLPGMENSNAADRVSGPQVPKISTQQAEPTTEPAAPKPKTKWNMFDE